MALRFQWVRETVARLIAWLIFRGPVIVTAGTMRLVFDPRTGRLRPSIAGADGEGEGNGEGQGGKEGDEEGEKEDEGEGTGKSEPDWKRESRKHESRSKAEKKRADALQAELEELKKGKQTDQEKAIEDAKKEAREAALSEAEKERRADRLEVAVTRLAAKGVKVGTGDDAKTVKFADPEDALVFIERAVSKGDIDSDDIFDSEGKVQTDALTTALSDLLERKPNLAADSNGSGRAGGSSDAGKGSSTTALDEMDVEQHLAAIKRHK